ncbi:DUF4870 domain-containing protein [filamentous cyanobacterium LEGE 11480]|uniref:DUF4870 domain-containing protein n=1 Tax=Romeriopsis navalis LEGE 11480 TaxID=2777977 RepID=A0A928VRP3_9CYAN|nr:DUF4870 domain-containing protein [Romeriopsis navalis]MBE9030929.1 DUF4870 domain-containing protein [Romeriopsis navalis LEGE 11480]
MQTTETADKRRLLSTISHVAIFFSWTFASIGVPLSILFISDDPVVKANAKESINFHLSVWIMGAVAAVLLAIPSFLTLGLLGWLAGGIGFLWVSTMTVLAVMNALANPDEPFRYPLILHIF